MDLKAVVLDMDGVVTKTAALHAKAWKQMFDAFLQNRAPAGNEDLSEFDIDRDYRNYIDGKPRYNGVRDFLASRRITLPEGEEDDAPGEETIRGLGNRKNQLFHGLLRTEGVEVWPDAVEQIARWRERGVRTGLITSSRNGRKVLEAAGLVDAFDAIIDGTDAAELDIEGKPAPDVFLAAVEALGVLPEQAMVVEDAIAGVEAGAGAGFGIVVGVDRGQGAALDQHGADIVLRDLRSIEDEAVSEADAELSRTPSAIERLDDIIAQMSGCKPVFFFDYDGTLAPIAQRPEQAQMPEEVRNMLRRLIGRVPTAIVSGRDLDDVRAMVDISNLYYAGSHGFDIAGPNGMRRQHEEAEAHLPELDQVERALRQGLESIEGAWVERKRFAVAVHYRGVDPSTVDRVASAVKRVHHEHAALRMNSGKKIFEFQPDVPWNKGYAVGWLLERLGLDRPDVLPVYLGDDTTDEDAFEALAERGLGIRVGDPDEPTAADYVLRDTDELIHFIRMLMARLERSEPERG